MNDNYPNRVKFLKIRFYKKILSLLKNKFYLDKFNFMNIILKKFFIYFIMFSNKPRIFL